MKRTILAFAASIAFSGAAFAADAVDTGPAVEPEPVASVYDWTGIYLGVHAGWGWHDSDWQSVPAGVVNDRTGDGGLGGVHAGFNWQTGNWILGAEAEIAAADIDGSVICPIASFTCGTRITWIGDVSARIGYAMDRIMVYGTGGFAFANANNYGDVTATGVLTFENDVTRTGWTVGVGGEYAFAGNFTLRVDYSYYDFGSDTNTMAAVPPPGLDATPYIRDLTAQTLKVGLSYKF